MFEICKKPDEWCMGELVRLFIEDANQGANMVRDDDSARSDW